MKRIGVRRRCVAGLGVGCFVMATLGGAMTGGRVTAADSTTVTVWSWRTEDEAAMNDIFAEFEAANPTIDVKLEVTPDADYQNRLSSALRGGEGPDIAQLKAYGELQPLVRAGYLDPLDDAVPALAEFPESALGGARSVDDGHLYGVPYSTPNMGVFYNTEIFDKYGLEVPTTYDEFVAMCDTLKSAGVVPIAAGGAGGSAWALEIMTGVMGPNIYGPDFFDEMTSGEARFTDPRWVAVLQRMTDLEPYYPDGFEAVDYTTATQMFINGEAAMFMGGSWENGSFKAQNPDLKFSIFAFPPDVAGDPAYTSTFSDGSYGLVADSDNKDAATAVLNFMASPDFAQAFADKLGWPPAREGITPNDPVLQEMVAMQANSTPYLTLVGFRWNTPTASEILQAGIIEVIEGNRTPDDLAAEMDAGVSTWFTPGATGGSSVASTPA
jgi:raffinose/stachyose/melibiose transport system substrate-binding protein